MSFDPSSGYNPFNEDEWPYAPAPGVPTLPDMPPPERPADVGYGGDVVGGFTGFDFGAPPYAPPDHTESVGEPDTSRRRTGVGQVDTSGPGSGVQPPTYVSPVDYNSYAGEPPVYDLKEMQRQAAARAGNPTQPEGYGATYVSPAAYNAIERGLGEKVWDPGPVARSVQLRQPYDIPQLIYEASNRKAFAELNDIWGGARPVRDPNAPAGGQFAPDVALDTGQVIDKRGELPFTGPRQMTYNPYNEQWESHWPWDMQNYEPPSNPMPRRPSGWWDENGFFHPSGG